MTSDREKLVALVWRRVPTELKVSVGGTKYVAVSGKLTPIASLSDAELFGVLRCANNVKTITKALEAA